MRLQGRVTEWNDERGFGFVTQNGTGARVFVHVSEFRATHERPAIGSLITYELGKDPKGRIQARNARFVGATSSAPAGAFENLLSAAALLLVLLLVGYVGYVWISSPNSTISATFYKVVFARDALRPHPEFQCRPEKNSCSRMTSCAEAFFQQERCGVSDMDGDHDGIPCERQWCN